MTHPTPYKYVEFFVKLSKDLLFLVRFIYVQSERKKKKIWVHTRIKVWVKETKRN